MIRYLIAALLLATPAIAQEQPRLSVPADLLTAIADNLRDGGTHREGQALSALLRAQAAKIEVAKPVPPATEPAPKSE